MNQTEDDDFVCDEQWALAQQVEEATDRWIVHNGLQELGSDGSLMGISAEITPFVRHELARRIEGARQVVYVAERDHTGAHIYSLSALRRVPLRMRLDLCNHSPSGFEWGYPGSGPAQAALAILADYLGRSEGEAERQRGEWQAVHLHQDLKRALIGNPNFAKASGWELTGKRIEVTLAQIRARARERGEEPTPALARQSAHRPEAERPKGRGSH